MSNPSLNSRTILQGRNRAPARSFLKGIGYTDEDLSKPIVGIANTWIEAMPCNFHLRTLAVKVKEGSARRRGNSHGVQHHRRERWDHYGHRRNESLPGES